MYLLVSVNTDPGIHGSIDINQQVHIPKSPQPFGLKNSFVGKFFFLIMYLDS